MDRQEVRKVGVGSRVTIVGMGDTKEGEVTVDNNDGTMHVQFPNGDEGNFQHSVMRIV